MKDIAAAHTYNSEGSRLQYTTLPCYLPARKLLCRASCAATCFWLVVPEVTRS